MDEIVTLGVEGMACGACERRLQTVIGRVDGVSEVDADHVTGAVRVRIDAAHVTPDVVAARAAERITQSGFTLPSRGEQGLRS